MIVVEGIGARNGKFGWIWLALFMVVGFAIEIVLVTNKEYAANIAGAEGTIGFTREMVRAGHAHGNLFALINIVFGLYIGRAALSDRLKNLASWLAIGAATIQPLGLIGIGFGFTPGGPLAAIGALAMIAAVVILAVGNVRRSSVEPPAGKVAADGLKATV